MPIFEYKCKNCGEKFELLILSQSDTAIICAKCGSENTERLFSSFASNCGGDAGKSSCGGSGKFS